MKSLIISAIGTVVILTLFFAVLINRGMASKSPRNGSVRGDGFAVLELFTSEGCSSCPAADELLARIQEDAGNTPVFVLSFHVDYWNRLGWKDIFSQAEFSKRQYWYSGQFAGQVYTPQLIMNGKTQFTGSDEPAITSAIKDVLEGKSATSLNLKTVRQGGKINVGYQVNGAAAGVRLVLAVVQKHAINKVSRGENEGLTLHHAQIVRNLYTFSIASAKQGSQLIDIPAGYNEKEWEIIGLLQDPHTGEIKSAGRAAIDPAAKNL